MFKILLQISQVNFIGVKAKESSVHLYRYQQFLNDLSFNFVGHCLGHPEYKFESSEML